MAASGRSPTTSGSSATTARSSCRRRPRPPPDRRRRQRPRVRAIVLTHGHNDHINAAVPLRDAVDAPIWLHDADRMLWDVVWPQRAPDHDPPARRSASAGTSCTCCTHRPLPGCCCFRDAEPGVVFSATLCSAAGQAPPAQLQRRADDPALDPRHVCRLLRRDRRPHRPRRVDDDRRRARVSLAPDTSVGRRTFRRRAPARAGGQQVRPGPGALGDLGR